MGTDLTVLNQILDREISNVVCSISPKFAPFSSIAIQQVHRYIDPYITAFLSSDGELDTDTIAEFAKDKVNSEIEAFKAKLNK